MARGWGLISGIALGLAAASARAEAVVLEDSVTLRSGAIYSGQIVEKVPGDHETLKLATGEIKRFAWADMDLTPAAAQPPTTSIGLAPLAPLARPAQRVLVKLSADNPVASLEELEGEAMVIDQNGDEVAGVDVTLCTAPCGVSVERRRKYRVAGDNVLPSDWFDLPAGPGPIQLHAETKKFLGHQWGFIGAVGGVGLIVGGGIVTALDVNSSHVSNTTLGIGIGSMIVGAVAAAIGIPFWIANGHTTVTADGGGQLAPN